MSFQDELISAFIEESTDLLLNWERVCIQLSDSPSVDKIQELFRYAHNMKGSSRTVSQLEVGNFVHKIEDVILKVKNKDLHLDETVLEFLLDAQKLLLDWVNALRKDTKTLFNYSKFDQKHGAIWKLISDSNIIGLEGKTGGKATKDSVNEFAKMKRALGSEETLRVSTQKLDKLILLLGELSIHQSIVWHSRGEVSQKNKLLSKSVQLGHKITKEVFETALSLRMHSVSTLFQKLERTVIEVSRSTGKRVRFLTFGDDVELDKVLIERITDPMIHMIRNSIDHGIETPDVRAVVGKNPTGEINIFVKKDAFGIEFEIKDDGAGVDQKKILNKAKTLGLVSDEQNLSERDIYNLIFLPGFSTADSVTDISGRGVGMEIVKKTIDQLKGSIEIKSVPGQGTQFSILLPISVNLVDSIIIRDGKQEFVVPVGSMVEVINIGNTKLSSDSKGIYFQNRLIPFVELREFLKVESGNDGNVEMMMKKNSERSAIVCEYESDFVAFGIDEIVGHQSIVIRPLQDNMKGSLGIIGGTVLGNGEPGMILDLSLIARKFLIANPRMESAA